MSKLIQKQFKATIVEICQEKQKEAGTVVSLVTEHKDIEVKKDELKDIELKRDELNQNSETHEEKVEKWTAHTLKIYEKIIESTLEKLAQRCAQENPFLQTYINASFKALCSFTLPSLKYNIFEKDEKILRAYRNFKFNPEGSALTELNKKLDNFIYKQLVAILSSPFYKAILGGDSFCSNVLLPAIVNNRQLLTEALHAVDYKAIASDVPMPKARGMKYFFELSEPIIDSDDEFLDDNDDEFLGDLH